VSTTPLPGVPDTFNQVNQVSNNLASAVEKRQQTLILFPHLLIGGELDPLLELLPEPVLGETEGTHPTLLARYLQFRHAKGEERNMYNTKRTV